MTYYKKWKALLAQMSPAERQNLIANLSQTEIEILRWEWPLWARTKQLPPPLPWRVWLLMAGRGFGKTRAGAEWVRMMATEESAGDSTASGEVAHRGEVAHPGHIAHRGQVALVGETADDVRHVMVEGPSGILAVSPSWHRPQWLPSRRLLIWPNGVVGRCYSASDPEQLRGPEHQFAWCDEVAKWPLEDAWHNLILGLRVGAAPRVLATTTPRPKRWLADLMREDGVITTLGRTAENSANLAPEFLEAVAKRYRNSPLGRQELDGVLMLDSPDALWQRAGIEAIRRTPPPRNHFTQVVIGVDPAVGGADETGIVVAGKDKDGLCWVLEDASMHAPPAQWAGRIIQASRFWQANRLIVEVNQGGNLIADILYTKGVRLPIEAVHARAGKFSRTEPVAAAYAEGKVFHGGQFDRLEDQMCSAGFDGSAASPDRLDAMVWALTALIWRRAAHSRNFNF